MRSGSRSTRGEYVVRSILILLALATPLRSLVGIAPRYLGIPLTLLFTVAVPGAAVVGFLDFSMMITVSSVIVGSIAIMLIGAQITLTLGGFSAFGLFALVGIVSAILLALQMLSMWSISRNLEAMELARAHEEEELKRLSELAVEPKRPSTSTARRSRRAAQEK